jgi:hypothetical protein
MVYVAVLGAIVKPRPPFIWTYLELKSPPINGVVVPVVSINNLFD